jgi:predicted dehydrogenase
LHWVLDQGTIGERQLWISGGIGGDWSPDRIVARTPWRHQKLKGGGGGSIDIGVHLFHLMRYLMGPVEEVSAYIRTLEPERIDRDETGAELSRVRNEVEDVFFANLKFTNGAIGTTFWSWGGHGEPTGLVGDRAIYGTTGCIKGDEIVLDDGPRAKALDRFQQGASPDLRETYFPGGVQDTFALEMHDFLNAITTGHAMEASGAEGLNDLATAFAILESATANRPVKVADVLSGAVNGYQEEIDQHYQL